MTEYKTPIEMRRRTSGYTGRAILRTFAAGAGLVLPVALLASPTTATAHSESPDAETGAQPYEVIASGLDNPRHLSLSSRGDLYVAESGTGGDGPCIIGGEGASVCYGPTGSITKVTRTWHHWRQDRVAAGLPSLAGPDGSQASGPSDVEVRGNRHYVVSIGLGAEPAARDQLGGAGAQFGTLLQGRFAQHEQGNPGWRVLADIAAHEARTNPVDDPDSNPASVLRRGSHYLVADAGGNTVVDADHRGAVRTLAAFADGLDQPPSLGFMQFVPTSAVVGPDGAYYVSQLTGFPFPQGAAKIYRFVPGDAPTVYATGLTNVTDLAFARDGSLYAVETSAAGLASGEPPIGAVVKVAPGGGGASTVVADGLFAPYGIALHRDSAYVTTGSVIAGGGQVVKIPLG